MLDRIGLGVRELIVFDVDDRHLESALRFGTTRTSRRCPCIPDATGIDQATVNIMEEEAMKFEQLKAMAAAAPGADGAMSAPTDQQQSCEEQNASEVLMSGGGPMMSHAIMTHDTSPDPTAGFTPSHDASK